MSNVCNFILSMIKYSVLANQTRSLTRKRKFELKVTREKETQNKIILIPVISTNSCLSSGLNIGPCTHVFVFLLHPTQFGIAILFRNLKNNCLIKNVHIQNSPCTICLFHLSQIKIHYKNCHLYVWTWNDSHSLQK